MTAPGRPNAGLDEHGRRRARRHAVDRRALRRERLPRRTATSTRSCTSAPTANGSARSASNVFAWPHGIYVDAGGNVWVTDARGGDDRGHQVIKFAPNGRELLRLGTSAHAGDGQTHFNGPTDVVVGAERRRVRQRRPRAGVEQPHREVRRRRPLSQGMGRHGSAPGQFLVPHALALDSQGRLFVADRDNNRIQIFDQDGNFLDGVDAVRPAERHSHRGRRHAVRVGQPIERRAPSRLAARHLRRQREGRLGQRVHPGPRVRSDESRKRPARTAWRPTPPARSTAPRSIRRA